MLQLQCHRLAGQAAAVTLSQWEAEITNYEGLRVKVDEGEGREGWLMNRMSLHEPIVIFNVESVRHCAAMRTYFLANSPEENEHYKRSLNCREMGSTCVLRRKGDHRAVSGAKGSQLLPLCSCKSVLYSFRLNLFVFPPSGSSRTPSWSPGEKIVQRF